MKERRKGAQGLILGRLEIRDRNQREQKIIKKYTDNYQQKEMKDKSISVLSRINSL